MNDANHTTPDITLRVKDDLLEQLRSTRTCSVCDGDGCKSDGRACVGCDGAGHVLQYGNIGIRAADEIEQLQMDVTIFNSHRPELLQQIDAAQPSPEPRMAGDRDTIAAAIMGQTVPDFVEWANHASDYPNAYQIFVDQVYGQADRVIAALVTNHGCKSDLHPEYVTAENGTDHGYKSTLHPGYVPPEGRE